MYKKLTYTFLATSIALGGLSFYGFNKDKYDKVVEVDRGITVTKADFDDYLEKYNGQNYLKQLTFEKIVQDKYKVTDKEVDEELEGIKKEMNIKDDKVLEDMLKQQGIKDLKTFKSEMKKQLASFKASVDGVKIEEKDIKAEYEKQKEQVQASHILVADEAKANELYAKIQAGEDFAKLAKENSTDPGSAQKGGDLGFFSKGKMLKEFEETAFSLPKGQVSKPVKTEVGYHIIKVTDKKEVKYDDVKDRIKRELLVGKAKPMTEVMSDVFKTEKITVNDKAYKDTFKEPVAPTGQMPQQ